MRNCAVPEARCHALFRDGTVLSVTVSGVGTNSAFCQTREFPLIVKEVVQEARVEFCDFSGFREMYSSSQENPFRVRNYT
jgi:hypothetical protein